MKRSGGLVLGMGVVALVFSPLACGDDDETDHVCTPGDTRPCLGPGQCDGAQTCNAEGTGFGACDCGTGGTGGAGASGGEGGTGLTGGHGGSGAAAGAGGMAGGSAAGRQPPPRPTGAGPGDGSDVVLAVDQLFLGDRDWDGTPSTTAWELYSYDLDDELSTGSSTTHCQLVGGASGSVRVDGADGVDNSWGKHMMPILLGLDADFASNVNAKIAAGEFSLLIKIDDLGASADYDPLVVKWYQGRDLGSAPLFDGTDSWPVAHESLSNPADLESAQVAFSNSYLAGHVLVTAPSTTVTVEILPETGATDVLWPLTIHHAVVTMELATDRSEAVHGIIAGVLQTDEFLQSFAEWGRHFESALCPGSTLTAIQDQIRQMSDIMADGTQDASETCNGITIGLGFTAKPVELGSVASPDTPPPDPC